MTNITHDIESLDAEVRISNLRSGVRFVTDPMSHTRSVAIACFVGVGSRDEPQELSGASHFLEHLLFKGTTSRTSREINRSIDAVGGEFNAYTVRESTVFYVRVPAAHQKFAAELLCEVIAQPLFDPADVEVERSVILGELDGALDSPDDVVFMNLAESLFPGHPLGRETLGDEESLHRMTVADLAAFHDRWYRPTNLIFAAAGAVDHDMLGEIVDERWQSSPMGERPVRIAPAPTVRALIKDSRPLEQAHLAIGWQSVAATDPTRVPLGILNHALGDGPSSRLHEEIRERRGLAYAVSSSAASNIDTGSQTVYCATAPEHLDEVATVVNGSIDDLLAHGIDAEELAVAQGYLTGSLLMALEDSSARMSRIGSAIANHGRVIPIAESLASIAAVTLEDVSDVAHSVFGGDRAVSLVVPSDN